MEQVVEGGVVVDGEEDIGIGGQAPLAVPVVFIELDDQVERPHGDRIPEPALAPGDPADSDRFDRLDDEIAAGEQHQGVQYPGGGIQTQRSLGEKLRIVDLGEEVDDEHQGELGHFREYAHPDGHVAGYVVFGGDDGLGRWGYGVGHGAVISERVSAGADRDCELSFSAHPGFAL